MTSVNQKPQKTLEHFCKALKLEDTLYKNLPSSILCRIEDFIEKFIQNEDQEMLYSKSTLGLVKELTLAEIQDDYYDIFLQLRETKSKGIPADKIKFRSDFSILLELYDFEYMISRFFKYAYVKSRGLNREQFNDKELKDIRDFMNHLTGIIPLEEKYIRQPQFMIEVIVDLLVYKVPRVSLIDQYKKILDFPIKTENIDYFVIRYGEEEGKNRINKKSARVKGKNNPGFQHGGKFSPFSKKFIAYEKLSDEEKENSISEVAAASKKTKEQHPENENTKLEYYTSRGMSEEEAIRIRSERQSTFSLEKCIKRYGEYEGRMVWENRQERWQNTLRGLPKDTRYRIHRERSKAAWSTIEKNYEEATVYLMYSESHKLYKFGITTNPKNRLKDIINDTQAKDFKLISTVELPIEKVFETETLLCDEFREMSLFELDCEEYGNLSVEYLKTEKPLKEIYSRWNEIVSGMI